ncbi:hypothetical protein [Kitasatospora sp. NPDC057223]|uniref:DUF7144 family membrane protein n=1 Tax=Kitasatospora sp. NPDC057223 TaxID=3346055 RepID=UPI00362BD629
MSNTTPTPEPQPWRAGPTAPATGANSGWVTGMVLFAAVLMMLNGLMDVFRGIMAVAKDDVFVSTPNYVFQFDLTAWGWIHMAIGVLLAVTGFFLLRGAQWARFAGILLASLSAMESFLALPYYPLWSLVVIALDVFVIWALCVYRPDQEPLV